jgi:ATP-dependent helicase/nuclease subunit A
VAAEHARSGTGGLAGFLEHIEARERHVRREASGGGAEGLDTVHVMTVHSAKGLEFPYVVHPEAGRSPRAPRDWALLECEPDRARLALRAPAEVEHGLPRAATPGWEELAGRLRERQRDEEKRILYVACTRAREALLVVGSARLEEAPGTETPIDWLREALGPDPSVVRIGPGDGVPEGPRWREPSPTRTGPVAVPRAPVGAHESDVELHLSYTALSEYARCSLRFLSTRIEGMGPTIGAEDASAAIGRAVHAAVAHAGQRGALEDERLDALARANALDEEGRATLQEHVVRLLASEDLRRARAMDAVAFEADFAVDIGPAILTGVLDVYARSGDEVLIVDHKTGPSSSDAHGDRALQAACYALAALADGADRVEVVFSHADGGREAFEFAEDADALSAVRGIVGDIRHGRFAPLESYDPASCPSCPAYGATCPVPGPSTLRRRN